MNLNDVTFTFHKSPEENLQLMQKALKEAAIPADRIAINKMYSHYVKTLPYHEKLLRAKEEREEKDEASNEEKRIKFKVVN